MKPINSKLIKQLIVSAAVLWAPVLLFASLASEVTEREPLPFDLAILNTLHRFSSLAFNTAATILTELGSFAVVTGVTVLLAAVFYRTIGRRAAYIVLLTAGGAALMNSILKLLFQRTRPGLWQTIIQERTYSFPSGHAVASSAMAFSLMVIFWETRWRWLVVAVGSLYFVIIGLTRIYLGVHFPSDVLAGWCVGLAWAMLVRKVLWRNLTN